MKLVIAEKRSVAQAIAQALDPHPKAMDGYIQTREAMVSWAQGHLVDLAEPDKYGDEPWHEGRWRMEDLPIDPMEFKWETSHAKGAGERYRQLVGLMRRDDVDGLVNACDPDREGEAIFRRITMHSGVGKPASRLWVASLEEEAIRNAWQTMRPESEYDGLARAADARAKADWLVGMNATRAHTIAYRRTLVMGRVQTPTLALIVERDRQIDDHKPQTYWKVAADMGGWTLVSDRIDDQDEAERLRSRTVGESLHVDKAERKTVHDRPPRLYDLTGLQKDMSRLHGMTAADTLAALQHLYELKLATYPRTDSQYITHDDLPTLDTLITSGRLIDGFLTPAAVPANPRPALAVNDEKVAGHTAILPTTRLDAPRLADLAEPERKVITRIVRRMWEAVGGDRVRHVTSIEATCAGIRFTAREDRTISPGWTAIETEKPADEADDAETSGSIPEEARDGVDLRAVSSEARECVTQPPKPFTEATLLAAMEHASRYVEDKHLKAALEDDTSHSGGIGTPATRADIIEKLVSSKYAARKGKQLRSTPEGRLLIHVAAPELTDIRTTAEWEDMLAGIEHGRTDEDEFLGMIRGMCADMPGMVLDRLDPYCRNDDTGKPRQEYGPCPRCGQPVIRTGSIWQCSTNRSEKTPEGDWQQTAGCGYKIFGTLAGRKLTDQQIRQALSGATPTVTGFTSRSGKKFDARIQADPERGVSMLFDKGGNR
ncbi:type IA DNA topoisomerase [Bifidobacterium miconisargentati]|uniref:type IA DNA topoisomerase n=1 Tax=Bifidobacterium miconisargentati TaxID=2834437 RepID=UPI001BDC8204|nr:type IA DNA topoisomerase [Bifidobacterium miconisargentati]MBW3089211.1 topoisomerase C-terminal repeat-containing protein [Bifidobacterium miconisargentati]